MKGQTFTPANSKRGRQYTAAKGTGSLADYSMSDAMDEQIKQQRIWNKLKEAQKEAKKKLQSAG